MKEINLQPIFYLDNDYWYIEFQNNNDFILLDIKEENNQWKININSNLEFFSYYIKLSDGREWRNIPIYFNSDKELDGQIILVGKDYQSYTYNFKFNLMDDLINLLGLENSLFIENKLVIEMDEYVSGLDCLDEIMEDVKGNILPYLTITFDTNIEENEVIDINGIRLLGKCNPNSNNWNEFKIEKTLKETLKELLSKIDELIDPRLYKDYLIYNIDENNLIISSSDYFEEVSSYKITIKDIDYYLKWVQLKRLLYIEPENRMDYLIQELPYSIGWNYKVKFRLEYEKWGNLPVWINGIGLKGKWNADYYFNLDFQFIDSGQMIIYEVPITYKIFNLDNIYFDVYGEDIDRYLEFELSFSQDNKITWTEWIPYPRNISPKDIFTENWRISPLKFFNMRWRIKRVGHNDCGVIILNDIILEGKLQNITCSYEQLGILGMRQCCGSNIFTPVDNNNMNKCLDGNYCPPPNSVLGCNDVQSNINQNFGINLEKIYNPYKSIFSKLIPLNNQILNQVNQIVGIPITYYKTAVDANGTDVFLHEYNLKNVVKRGDMKVILPNNTLPDDELLMNMTDMGAFLTNSFEIQITKEEFKRVFGIEMRPEKNDIILLCNWNRLYEVEFSFAKKKLMGSSLYYSVYIKKYEDRGMVNKEFDNSISEEIHKLTDFTSLDMFEKDIKSEEIKIKKENQFKNLNDISKKEGEIRKEDMVIKSEVSNYGNLISDFYYDFQKLKEGLNKIALRHKWTIEKWTYFSFYFWIRMDKLVSDSFVVFNINKNDQSVIQLKYENNNFFIITGSTKTAIRFSPFETSTWYVFYFDFNLLNKTYNFYSFKQIKDGVKTDLIEDRKLAADNLMNKTGFSDGDWNFDFYSNFYHMTNLALLNKRYRLAELKSIVGFKLKEDEEKLVFFDLAYPRYLLEKSLKPNNKDDNYGLGSNIL